MADIFSGTDAPAWLANAPSQAAKVGAEAGNLLGTGLGAGWMALTERDTTKEKNPDTGKFPRLSFGEAWQQARLNQADPMWKLKAEQTKAEVATRLAQATTANALAQAKVDESRAWIDDVPELAKWRKDPQYVPTLKSEQGNKFFQDAERYSGANQIYRDGAKAWSSMLNNLSKRGGQYAVLAGEFAGTHGRIPSDAEKAAFGERLSRLGVSEQELIAEVGAPTSAKSGPGGTQFNYNAPELKAKADQQAADNAAAQARADTAAKARADAATAKAKADKEAAEARFTHDKELLALRNQYQAAAKAVESDTKLNTIEVQVAAAAYKEAEKMLLQYPKDAGAKAMASKYAKAYSDAVDAARAAMKAAPQPSTTPVFRFDLGSQKIVPKP